MYTDGYMYIILQNTNMYMQAYLDKLLGQYIFHQAQLGHLGRNSLQHNHWDN